MQVNENVLGPYTYGGIEEKWRNDNEACYLYLSTIYKRLFS